LPTHVSVDFDTVQVVDVSRAGRPHPAAKALYFTVAGQ
jgi:hypothetical protein